jgi:hypothetical protein
MSNTPDSKITEQPQRSVIQVDKMKESPHIWGDSNFNEIEDVDIDETKIFWMGTNASLTDTPQEQLENKLAIQEQVKNGILDEFGLPTGFTYDELGIPIEKQNEIKAMRDARNGRIAQSIPQSQNKVIEQKRSYNNKFERKLDRERLREEQKKREKLEKANRLIHHHQTQPFIPKK